MRILVIRVGRVGDVVMITAALKALLKRYPAAQLHALTSPDGRRVLSGFNNRLTRLIIHDRKSIKERLLRPRVRQEIAGAEYSDIFCFETNPSYQRFFKGSRAHVRQVRMSDEIVNYARRCLDLVGNGKSRDNATEWIYLPVGEQGQRRAWEMLAGAGIDDDTYVVGFHPSFSGLRKVPFRNRDSRCQRGWPVEAFAALARQLTDYAAQKGMHMAIVMDLLPEDRSLGESIVRASEGRIRLLTPAPDFERYKATLQRMNLLITPNTGPMHIAGAVGTRMVALFCVQHPGDSGPYVPPAQWVALRAEDTLAPHLGLAAIAPIDVFEACRRYLPV